MNTPLSGRFKRLGSALDISGRCPCEAANGGISDDLRDFPDRFEVTIRGNGKAGFDHIDPHVFENGGNAKLLIQIHGGTRRLLAVTQGRVKNKDAVRFTHLAYPEPFAHLQKN